MAGGQFTRRHTKATLGDLLKRAQMTAVTLTQRFRRFVLVARTKYLVAPEVISIELSMREKGT